MMIQINKPRIADHMREPEGWSRIPHEMLEPVGFDMTQTASFFNEAEGFQILASMVNFNQIHVTLTPVCAFRKDLTEAQIVEKLEREAGNINTLFFGSAGIKLPNDPRHPRGRHYLVEV